MLRPRSAALVLAAATMGCSPPFLSGQGNPDFTPTPTFTFAGRVLSNQSGAPIAGAVLTLNGASATTAGDGSFSVEVGEGATPVTISAPGFLTRSTFLGGGSTRTGRSIDLIATGPPFSLDYFDRLARSFGQPEFGVNHILRWNQNPNFYIITKYTAVTATGRQSTDADVPQADLNRIAAIIQADVAQLTAGRLQAGSIQFRPDYRQTIEPGWVQVEIGERPAGLDALICGRGGVSITFQGNNLSNEIARTGFMRVFPDTRCTCPVDGNLPASSIVAHELGHALGFFHTDPHAESLMYSVPETDCSQSAFPASDVYHAALAYTRPVGNTTPDNDPGGFALAGAGGRRTRTFTSSCGLPGAF